jgi:hypothetical protein
MDTIRALGLDPAKVVSAGRRQGAVSIAGTWALNGVNIVLSESGRDVVVEDGTVAFVQPYLGSNIDNPVGRKTTSVSFTEVVRSGKSLAFRRSEKTQSYMLGRPTSNYDLWQTDYRLTIENARRMTGESQATFIGVGATGNVTTSQVTFVKCADRSSSRAGLSGLWVSGEIVNILMDGRNLRIESRSEVRENGLPATVTYSDGKVDVSRVTFERIAENDSYSFAERFDLTVLDRNRLAGRSTGFSGWRITNGRKALFNAFETESATLCKIEN